MDKTILNNALAMPIDERMAFAELLLASIDIEENGGTQTRRDEVNARIRAVNEGSASLLDFESLYNEDLDS